jgi:hypothetical protein
MKTVAQYAFTGNTKDKNQAKTLFDHSCQILEKWLKAKGFTGSESGKFTLSDGAFGDLEIYRLKCIPGSICRWILTETRKENQFSTKLELAIADAELVCTCSLSSGSTGKAIAPRSFTARCPGVLRDILKQQPGWCIGTSIVPTTPLPAFVGKKSALPLVSEILSATRTLPIIVISRYDGFLLHPSLVKILAADVCGLGIVADIDDEAAWEMTRQIGKEWSCFNGGIRIYWPNLDRDQSPRSHPLWTSERLMYMVSDTEQAARRIRNVIRKRLFSVSTFALGQSPLLDRLEDESAHEVFQEKLRLATSAEDYQNLAEEFDRENVSLRHQLRQEREIIKQLRQDLYNLQLVRAYADADEEVTPDEDTPPETVEDAVDKAQRIYAMQLTFGNDVQTGIPGLAHNAGPPQKILDYLAALASMADERREKNTLGTTVIQWLANKGVVASNESETVKRNRVEMKKRTWHDGRWPREFEMHLKPTEAAHPDRCPRIYFDWDEASAKVVIGWVGRHP